MSKKYKYRLTVIAVAGIVFLALFGLTHVSQPLICGDANQCAIQRIH